jgi:hypothetical protein
MKRFDSQQIEAIMAIGNLIIIIERYLSGEATIN